MLPKGFIGKIFDYYFGNPDYEDEIMRAFREFFERPDLKRGGQLDYNDKSEGFFNEWFLYDFKFSSDENALANFIKKNPLNFSPSKLKKYKDILETQTYGLYEVLSVDIGYGLKLKNLQNDGQTYVHEKSLTYQVRSGDLFFARIAHVETHYEIIGADSFKINLSDSDRKNIQKKFSHIKFTPQFVHKVWSDRQTRNKREKIMGNITNNE